jgi:hypothetical protein
VNTRRGIQGVVDACLDEKVVMWGRHSWSTGKKKDEGEVGQRAKERHRRREMVTVDG